MTSRIAREWPVAALGLVLAACAGSDNPVALADREPHTELEIDAAVVETFEEVELHAHITEHGSPMGLREVHLEIEHASGGPVRSVQMSPEGDEYAAHVTFFQPGDNHVTIMGRPPRHGLMMTLGEFEVHAERRHEVIGDYWVELEVLPAPLYEGDDGDIRLLVYEHEDGGPGHEASGLHITGSVHLPGGGEVDVEFEELTHGIYEVRHRFVLAGVYEIHVELEGDAHDGGNDGHGGEDEGHGDEGEESHSEGEFHIPVLSPSTGEAPGHGDDQSGGGHGH